MPIISFSRMNHIGMFSTIMTGLLLFAVCISALGRNGLTDSAWLSMRSVYYFAGILVSGYYLHYLSGHRSTNVENFSALRWNNMVPLAFCVFGLILSLIVGRTRPTSTDGYTPHQDTEQPIIKDDFSR